MSTAHNGTRTVRVVFSFDEHSHQLLRELATGTTLADAVRRAVRLAVAVQRQEGQGFREIVLRNAKGEERVLVVE